MPGTNLFAIFIERIDKCKINYFVGGSVSAIVYGEPRLTHDIDLVLHLNKIQVQGLIDKFSIEDFYLPPQNIINSELERGEKGHFNIIHQSTGFKADIYFVGNDPLQQWALENLRLIEFSNLKLPVAPPEYIIVKKLLFYKEGKSEKHIEDIKGILRESGDLINEEILKNFLSKYGLKDIYNQINNDASLK